MKIDGWIIYSTQSGGLCTWSSSGRCVGSVFQTKEDAEDELKKLPHGYPNVFMVMPCQLVFSLIQFKKDKMKIELLNKEIKTLSEKLKELENKNVYHTR